MSALPFASPVIGLGVAFLSFRPGAIALPRAALVVGVWLMLVSLAGLTLVPVAMLAWRREYWSRTRRTTCSLVALAFLVGVPLLGFWKVFPL